MLGQPDPFFGEIVTAFVVLRKGCHAGPEELASSPRSAWPTTSARVFLQDLPKGPPGKVHRRLLKKMGMMGLDLAFEKLALKDGGSEKILLRH